MVELEDILVVVDTGIEKAKPQIEEDRKEIAARATWLQTLTDKAAENGIIIHVEGNAKRFEDPILRVHPEGDIFAIGKKIFPDCGYGDLMDLAGRNASLKRAFAGMKELKDIYVFVRCE